MENDDQKETRPAQDVNIQPEPGGDANPEIPHKPPRPDSFDVEREWADRLGMDFDASRATPPPAPEKEHTSFPPPAPSRPQGESRMYIMPPGEQLPPHTPQPPMPSTYMIWAILSMICCCMPAGIVAIIYSASVSSRYFARDYAGARRASRNAQIWIIVSIVTGIVANALYVPLTLLMPS